MTKDALVLGGVGPLSVARETGEGLRQRREVAVWLDAASRQVTA